MPTRPSHWHQLSPPLRLFIAVLEATFITAILIGITIALGPALLWILSSTSPITLITSLMLMFLAFIGPIVILACWYEVFTAKGKSDYRAGLAYLITLLILVLLALSLAGLAHTTSLTLLQSSAQLFQSLHAAILWPLTLLLLTAMAYCPPKTYS